VYSPALQSLLVQTHVQELHRAAPISPGAELDRAPMTSQSGRVKRVINRLFDRGCLVSEEAAAIQGYSTPTWSPGS
jgi:hypothetical protein